MRQLLTSLIVCLLFFVTSAFSAEPQRKIVLIAGPKSHGPVGNGIHDYPWSVKLLKVMLDNSNIAEQVRVEYHLDGWPADPATLDDADTIMVISDGRDGDLYAEAPHFGSPEHLAQVQKQIDRGCGFCTFHFSTFAPDQYAKQILDWSGGYFDWEENGQKKWYSAIQVHDTTVEIASPQHPVSRGLKPFQMKEEFYFNLRFQPEGDGEKLAGLAPLLSVPVLPGREPDGKVVAWAKERANGGRGFGTTCGHFYDNWKVNEFRTMILNALAWTAHVDVPAEGVQARYFTHQEITAAISGKTGTERASLDEKPIRVLLVAGNEAHKWHNWERTTPVIKSQLEFDPRVKVTVSTDIEGALTKELPNHDVLVQNSYANWHDPKVLSPAAQKAWVDFLQNGGGMVVIHFANGAWNFSLPMAETSDWPEYRKLVRRVWNHKGEGDAKSGHDAFGPFQVNKTSLPHPIMEGLTNFAIVDELYYRQDGADPIEPLIVAHSKDTQRDEPLAWTYNYGKGHIFQTLLGHSERTYETFEACEMLRRAVAWSAGRNIIAMTRDVAPSLPVPVLPATSSAPAKPVPAPKASGKLVLADGKFGKALDAAEGGAFFAAHPEHRSATVTVDCWTKLASKDGYNILVASEPKASPTHWEMYSHAGSGLFAVYMPGRGGDYRTEVDIADGQWHHVSMVFEPGRIRLEVDGKLALDKPLPAPLPPAEAGPMAIGQLVEGGIGCHGLIDEVRFTRGVREFNELPTTAPVLDERQLATTLGLWRFDKLVNGRSPDECKRKLDAFALAPAGTTDRSPESDPDHWGSKAVGFDWTEKNSVDGRWQDTEIGRWLASIVALPGSAVRKGLSIRVGDQQDAVLCYDTEVCGLRAIWTGGFLKFDPARFGIIASPQPDGTIQLTTQEGAQWGGKVQFRRMYAHDPRVVLEYVVDNTMVRESPWREAGNVFTRQFEVEAGSTPLNLMVIPTGNVEVVEQVIAGRPSILQTDGAMKRRIVLLSEDGSAVTLKAVDKSGRLTILPREKPVRFKLVYSTGFEDDTPSLAALLPNLKLDSLAEWISPGPARWTETITTRGTTSFSGKGPAVAKPPYVVDTVTLPFNNPYKALLFTTGIDFPPAGPVKNGIDPLNTLYVCTLHGDVWQVSGVDGELRDLTWKRFATGLFQPLGLKIHHRDIYVLGRDQITRLKDRDGNGEADDYECFTNLHETSVGGHDYVACLEVDTEGRFYFVHATQGAVRISADGQSLEILGTGLRNPNGMGLGPHDELTASPQEGEWTPGTGLYDVQKGDHFGYKGPLPPHKFEHPVVALHDPLKSLGVKAPFAWIPRRVDNSSGGQVWVTSDRWGTAPGTMLHLSYGQCTMLQVMQEKFTDTDGSSISQGGTVSFPFTFDSGVCRGRFSPHDGQLYVTGLRGWVNSAAQDGCIQRVRYTGGTPYLPTAVRTYKNGLAIKFPGQLLNDVSDPGNYRIERWNMMYSPVYGSQDYKLSQPNEQGHDEVNVISATRLDSQTVFLETDEMVPCCQLTVRFTLHLESGEKPTRSLIAYTIHRVPEERIPDSQIVRTLAPGTLSPEQLEQLRPGLKETFEHGRLLDHRVARMASTSYPPLVPSSPWVTYGPTAITKRGWLKVPERGLYQFRLIGTAEAELRINGHEMIEKSKALPISDVAEVDLRSGYNEIIIKHGTPNLSEQNQGVGAQLRVLWSGPDFIEEPLPPTVLFHAHDQELEQSLLKREGRELFETLRCARCHNAPEGVHVKDAARWAGAENAAPSLKGVSQRLQPAWLLSHLLAPATSANDPLSDWSATKRTMPQLFDASRPEDRAAAADLVAYLTEGATAPVAFDEEEQLVDRGRTLFEDLGCLSCHTLNRQSLIEGPEVGRNRKSLDHVKAKFLPTALRDFLKAPTALHVGTRMPDFKLTDDEANALAALLMRSNADATIDSANLVKGNAAQGAKLFQSRGCAACHSNREGETVEPPRRPALTFREIGKGCLAETTSNAAPAYALTDHQRRAVAAFFEHPGVPESPESLSERAESLIRRLNCVACHTRDSQISPRGELITEEGETGLAPELLPQLTWTGEKLHEAWVAKLLKGEHPERPRPWLKARMPAFPAYADVIAAGLAAQHGIPGNDADAGPTPIPHGAEIGAKLMQKEMLDCRQCHALGAEPPTGDAKTLLAPGINFALTRDRMRYDFYRRWAIDPPRYDIGTRMPKLAADGKTTKVRQVLDGDAQKQFDAIWEFLNHK
jgi:type 1 glutamine amidotransferase/mono/diheme cytochrome c family protein